MEDAYTVGIRLLLEDGVSPGVATILRSLADADRAVAATRAGLVDLRGVAAGMAAPVLPVRAEARGVPPVAAAPGAVVEPVVAPAPARAAPVEGVERQPVRVVAEGAPRAPVPVRAVAAPPGARAPVVSVAPVVAPAAVGRGRADESGVPVRAPVPVRAEGARPQGVAPVRRAAPDFARFAPVAPLVVMARALPPAPKGLMAPALPPAMRARAAPDVVRQRAPVAPMPVVRDERAGPVPPADVARPAEAGPAGRDGGEGGGPTGGDVFLDGMRVGRWMARELGRQGSLPPAGATGFDPRLGMSWPGAMQGS